MYLHRKAVSYWNLCVCARACVWVCVCWGPLRLPGPKDAKCTFFTRNVSLLLNAVSGLPSSGWTDGFLTDFGSSFLSKPRLLTRQGRKTIPYYLHRLIRSTGVMNKRGTGCHCHQKQTVFPRVDFRYKGSEGTWSYIGILIQDRLLHTLLHLQRSKVQHRNCPFLPKGGERGEGRRTPTLASVETGPPTLDMVHLFSTWDLRRFIILSFELQGPSKFSGMAGTYYKTWQGSLFAVNDE